MSASSSAIGSVKVIGSNGQISLGKQFAGRQVLVEEQEPGVWLIRTASVILDNESWLQGSVAASDRKATLTWARANNPAEGDIDTLLTKLDAKVSLDLNNLCSRKIC